MHTLSHANSHKLCSQPSRVECLSCPYCGMVFSYKDMLLLHVVSRHKQRAASRLPLDLSVKTSVTKKRQIDDTKIYRTDSLCEFRNGGESPILLPPLTPTHSKVPRIRAIPVTSQALATVAEKTSEFQHQVNSMHMKAGTLSVDKAFKSECTSPKISVDEEDDETSTSQAETSTTPTTTTESSNADASIEKRERSPQCQSTALAAVSSAWISGKPVDSHSVADNSKHSLSLRQMLSNSPTSPLYVCVHCNIIFLDRAMYNLHVGLHNCNSPLQCNICGKNCATALEFSAHIIHN